jgi:hypothetical protein
MTENQRMLKKLSIIGLILSFIIVAGLFSVSPEEQRCFNGIRDVDEEGIDCGGICKKKCPPLPKPPSVSDIEVEWVKYIEDGKGNYDLVASLSNSNERWGVSSVDYKFTVFNEGGKIIGARKDQMYIMPRGFLEGKGTKYLVENNFKTEEKIGKVNLELSNFNWDEIKDVRDLPELNTKIIKINSKDYGLVKNGSEFYYASGVTENTSKYSFFRVDIKVVLFDGNGELIAAGRTDQWTLEAGGKREFKIYWTKPFSGKVEYADYEAETNVFSLNNFMKDYGTKRTYTVPR